jgi:hypothetical protein
VRGSGKSKSFSHDEGRNDPHLVACFSVSSMIEHFYAWSTLLSDPTTLGLAQIGFGRLSPKQPALVTPTRSRLAAGR